MARLAVTPASVMEHMFTRPSPTGGAPPPEVAWVIFDNGTVFYTGPTEALGAAATTAEIERAARDALAEIGPVIAGSPSADFNVVRLEQWFPDDPVYFVTFDDPRIAAVIIDEVEAEVTAGLLGRAARDADRDDPQVVEVRGFDGTRGG